MTGIGLNIRKIRELRNYTQQHMAEKLDISQGTYCKMENNELAVKRQMLEEIANILEVTPEQLRAFDEDKILNAEVMYNINHNENIHHYAIDSKLEKLYEDKIKYLEEQVEHYRKLAEQNQSENELSSHYR